MDSVANSTAALLFLIPAAPVAVWVAHSDMSRMKIPNKAVAALFLGFVIFGIVAVLAGAMTWPEYGWRFVHMVVVLIIGFIISSVGMVGAGDAKFAAAMAPMVALGDWPVYAYVFAASILGGFTAHRIAKRIPFVRNRTEGWESWQRRDFPMGLCLSISLVAYLFVAIANGV